MDESSSLAIISLLTLNGDITVIDKAKDIYSKYDSVLQALDIIDKVIKTLILFSANTKINIDLGEVDGYGYHNGLIFSVYQAGTWQPLARGGRYDNAYHSETNRPATGLSCNLNILSKLIKLPPKTNKVIICDLTPTTALIQYINKLRETDIVLQTFADADNPKIATHKIKLDNNGKYYLVIITE